MKIDKIANAIAIYSMVLILLWFGVFKFTSTEAKAIKGLVENSPLISWMYSIGSMQGISNFIGVFEVVIAFLLALYPLFPRLSLVGGIGGSIIFLTTVSFLFTTPGMFEVVDSLFVPAGGGGFIIKDLVLLGICLQVIALSLQRIRKERVNKPIHAGLV
jgi:uncharacterized membrane protein YkgB